MERDSIPLSIRVVEEIAEREGVAPTELGYSLHDYLDPDVLDRLDETHRNDWSLRFSVAGHSVVADGDGTITIDGIDAPERSMAAADD